MRKGMALQHEDVWKLLGINRGKFRRIRHLHPNKEGQRNYDTREVFAFKILLTLVNQNVPSLVDMEHLRMDTFFHEIKSRNHVEIKRSLVLWHTTQKYIKVINKGEKYKKTDYNLNSLRLKKLYKDYLYQLGELGYTVKDAIPERELTVIQGGKN